MSRATPDAVRGVAAALILGCAATPAAHAQQLGESGGGRSPPASGLSIKPRVGLSEAWTDNLRPITEQGTVGPRDAALITTLSPGLNIVSRSGWLRGSLDYALNGIAYAKSDEAARLQNALNATGTAELIERSLFVDMRASISQQALSAFGAQTSDVSLANPNQREVISASITPAWRSTLAGAVAVDLQATESRTEVRKSSLGDSHTRMASLRLSAARPGLISPWLLLMDQHGGYADNIASSRLSAATAGASYRPDVDWEFNLKCGQERSNLQTGSQADGPTYGATAAWSPTPRTQLSADWQHHSYGDTHAFSLSHRTARTTWQVSDIRSVNLGNTRAGGLRTNYDLFFEQFASQEPDPAKRDQLVRDYLQSLGLSPDAPVNGGFLSAGASRLHSQQFSMAWRGQRTALTATLARSQTRRIGTAPVSGDLAVSGRVDQRSVNLSLAHQLTPQAAIGLAASLQQTRGDIGTAGNTLGSLTANGTLRLGQRLSAQLGLRHSRVTGPLAYRENGALASLTQQF